MEFEEIVNRHPGMKKRVAGLKKKEKVAKLLMKVEKMAGTKILVGHLKEMIEAINSKLLYEKMTETERECLMRERACWDWLIYQFDSQHKNLEKIKQFKEKYD